jgi:cell division protein FtsL
MHTRIEDIGTFFFVRSRRSGLRRLLVLFLIVIGTILYVGGKVKIVSLGYEIEALQHEKKEIERANRSLRIEASSLSSPARIEEIAVKRLGMVRPDRENVVVVKKKKEQAASR